MEPSNTSQSTAAAWASPDAALVEHRDYPSLLSPAFSPAPSPGLVLPASASGSEASWYQQTPQSPAVAAGNGSPTVSFSTAGTLPMVGLGYDLFGSPEGTPATPLPTLFGGQWQDGESSSSWAAAPVLEECPSPGMFGFAGEYAAWCSEDTSSFFAPSADGGQEPQSSDNLVGFAEPSSDSEELEALLEGFRAPSLAVEESPVDAPMPPVEEEEDDEEEMDVSAFLVSDPEDGQLPDASWTDSPQMVGSGGGKSAPWMAPGNTGNNWPPMLAPAVASTCTIVSTSSGSGGGASASWMAPGNTGNNWPPMLAPATASTCTMVSTSSGSTASHSNGSSIGVVSSFVGATMKPSSSVLPLVPPSSLQGAGASSSKFNGFAQPSSSSVVAPHAPNLQGPLLPVKQEVMDVDATARRHPDFISLDDDEEEGFYPDAIFGSWPGSSNGSPSFAPGSWGSSGVSPGFAPGNWGRGSSSSPSFAPAGSWGDGSSSSSPSFAPSSWGGDSSSSPSFDGSMRCLDESMSIDNYDDDSSFMQKLNARGRMASIRGLPPLPKSDVRGASSNSNGGTGMGFTDSEMAIIAKDKKLQELWKTDVKKLKRVLYNRAYSAAAKVRKVMHTKNLEHTIVTLQEKRRSLREELQSLQEGSAALKAQQMEMQMTIGELEQQTMLKDVVREGLKADIQNLKHLRLN